MDDTVTNCQVAIFVDKYNTSQDLSTSAEDMDYSNTDVVTEQFGDDQKTIRFISATQLPRAGAYAIPMKLVYLFQGDNLQLKARTVGGNARFQLDSHSTQITLVQLSKTTT